MIDRRPFEQFFAFRRFLPTLAFTPDAETVYFVTNTSGQFNLWSASVDGGRPVQLSAFTENTVRAVAVRDDGEVLFLADRTATSSTSSTASPRAAAGRSS